MPEFGNLVKKGSGFVKFPKLNCKLDYQWVIVALCFLMIFLGLGFCSSTRSIFLAPITEALEIKRSAFSIADSIRFTIAATVSVFYGSFIGRFGTKKLICSGLIFLFIACLIYSFADILLLFYIAGAFFGIGFSFTSTSMVGCILIRWCHHNTGTIMGVVLAANGIGSAIATQLFTPFIYEKNNPFGYRKAYLIMMVILLAALAVFIIFYKEHPPVVTTIQKPNSGKSDKNIWGGLEFTKVKKSLFFWSSLLCVFFTGFTLEGVYGAAAAHLKDSGLSAGLVATVVSVHSILISFSKVLCGFIYDKFGIRLSSLFCHISSIFALTLLMIANGSGFGKVFAFTYVVFSAFALPLETIMLPIFTGDLFGMKSYNQILGFFSAANTAGYALGIPIVNLCYDTFGSYIPIFLVLCGVMFTVFIVFQLVINKSNSLKKGINQL